MEDVSRLRDGRAKRTQTRAVGIIKDKVHLYTNLSEMPCYLKIRYRAAFIAMSFIIPTILFVRRHE